MCGIVGVVTGSSLQCDWETIERMMNAVKHRGPDSFGTWNEDGIWLGHRRLAIIDLSEAGHQPMQSADGRYVITYNGEIYNYLEIRKMVDQRTGVQWRGHSDTEVLLEAIGLFGVRETLQLVNGMFAFAVWDRKTRVLTLARDRFGEKPLYYATRANGFAFASEAHALKVHGGLNLSISRDALYWYFKLGYIPAPISIYENVAKLLPGHLLTWRDGICSPMECYWSLARIAERGISHRFKSEMEAVEALETELTSACRTRMISDVPLGAFLSGGVDSSVVVALMQASSSRPVKTFTIGFDVAALDESQYGRAVAGHLGTEHIEYIATEQDALSISSKLGDIYDEPFADPSSIPTYLVSAMCREHVTVCLSGDGGDELFAGYGRYQTVPRVWSAIENIPFRGLLARLVLLQPTRLLDLILRPLVPLAPGPSSNTSSLVLRVHRLAERLDSRNIQEYYDHIMRQSPRPEAFVCSPNSAVSWMSDMPDFDDVVDWICFYDAVSYLPGDILAKVDRATMAVSLEGRMPLLDPKVVETAWRIPASMKIKNGVAKWPLRQVLYKYVPEHLVDRPKMGFGIPLGQWLAGPLRPLVQDLLSYDRLRQQGVVNAMATSRCVDDFYSGKRPEPQVVWALLVLQIWLDQQP
jgi:asparagine synthase (glutamine-hydrolysing)